MNSQVSVVRSAIVAALVAPLAVVVGSATVSAAPSPNVTQLDLVGPAGSTFGDTVLVLENGNYVVVDSGFDNGANLDVGAVHLYGGLTDTVIDTVTGTTPGDQIGSSGVVEVGNSNYVIISPLWDNGAVVDAGAVTFGNGTTGVGGTTVTTANSLHGTTAGDAVGSSGVVALTNGNYTIRSQSWDNGGVADAGAVTFGNGAAGIAGPLTTSNSLHGTTASDMVGSNGVVALPNGNYTVASSDWDNGGVMDAGAVTFGSGTAGIAGPVSTANSLHGTTAFDHVGIKRVTALTSGNYVVASPNWDGASGDEGAVTFGNGTTGITGPVTTGNSLHGTENSDLVGDSGVVALTNGNYTVGSPFWNSPTVVDAGAVTFGNGTTGTSGAVSVGNSLHGTTTADFGFKVVVTALTIDNYVVANPFWDNGSVVDAGAVTFGNGTTGTTGPVSTANSLYGTTMKDLVGNNRVTALSNGNYTVASPSWNGIAAKAGAVTFGNGTTGVTGPVSTANSLYGSTTDDEVGGNQVVALTNGNYVVASQGWDNGATVDAGAATFGSGTTGITGPVSVANSLYGTTVGDQVGQFPVDALTNGNYAVRTPLWNKPETLATAAPEVNDAGAVTFGDGATGIAGPVDTDNSLHGSASADQVGSGGVTALTNGLYTVASPFWNNGGTADAGAVTFGVAAGGVVGSISSLNSAIGTPPGSVVQPGDQLTSNEALPVPTSQNRVLLLQLDLGIPVAPSAPSGVSGVAGDGEATVSWTAPTSDGGSAITGYTVTAAPGSGTCTTTGATMCVVTGLTNGIAYTFTVTATNTIGTSPASAPSSPVTPAAVPSAPSGVSGVAGDGEVTVSWTAPTSDGGSAITGYTVTAAPGGATCTTTGATSCTVTGLTNGTAYTFTVTATNTDGTSLASAPSSPVTPAAVPSAPSGVSGVAGDGEVTVSWTAPTSDGGSAITGYTVTASPGGATCTTTGATSCTVTGLTNGTAYTFTVRATNAAGMSAASAVSSPVTPDDSALLFIPVTPARVLDTRGGNKVGNAAGTGTPFTLDISGEGGLPESGIGAVALNVTVTQGENPTIGKGFVTVYPCGKRPEASNLNFTAGQTIPNSVIAPVSATGTVCFYVYGTAHLLADVSGYFPTGSDFFTVTPARVLDTRGGNKVGNAAGTGTPFTLDISGEGGLPESGIGAVALNVTVTQGENPTIGKGFVTVYPCGTRPEASNLNFTAGQTIPNSVIAPVSATGTVCFYVYGTAHLLADVSGYFPTGSDFFTVTPARVLDTRGGNKVGNAAGTGTPFTLDISGEGGLPESGIGAVALNVTVTQGENPTIGKGFVTVYPCGTRPEASNLNFTAGQTIPNSVIAPVSATGTVCFYVYGTAHLLADVSGYFPA